MAEMQLNNRRERRIAARQAQILDAAAQVFSRQGYERATTREIADIADVSEGTLYNYFNSKRDLLIGVAKAYADQIADEIARVEADDFGDMLAQLFANRFRTGRERRLFMLFLYESRNNADVHQILRAKCHAPHHRRNRKAYQITHRCRQNAPHRPGCRSPHTQRHHHGICRPFRTWRIR